MAATESDGRTLLTLPTCSTKSVESVRVVEKNGFRPVWEIEAAVPVTGVHQFAVGESVPGFAVLLPLYGELVNGVEYSAEVDFGGQPGPNATVDFTIGDLTDDAWWFDDRLGTREEFDAAARSTGLCGGNDFSLKDIFWSKFGVGLAVALAALVVLAGWRLQRLRRGGARVRS